MIIPVNNRRSNFRWQFYWKSWGLQYSRLNYMDWRDSYTGQKGSIDSVWLIIGPLQMRWLESVYNGT